MLIRTQLMLPKDIYDALKLEAVIKSTSMSKLVVKKIKAKTENKKISAREALEKMIKSAYRGKNAPRDLSTNDEYLYGKKGIL